MSTGFFVIALLVSAPGPTGLQKGDEFTFAGTVVENDNRPDRPGQRLRRDYQLTLRVFVLDRQENWADAAVLTSLLRTEDAVGGFARPVTGTGPDKNAPPIIRLDIVRIHTDGTLHLLVPTGRPFRLAADTSAQAMPPIPLDAFSPSELGVFPPRIPRSVGPGEPWTVAAGAARPDEVWVARKLEFINAEQCQMLVMNQQSADWGKPVGGQTSWHRADAVWVSTQDGTARKVHRVIRQRDGLTKTSFKLTDQVFVALKSENVPESVLTKLNPLKNKEFSRDDFVGEIKKLLNVDQTEQFLSIILNYTRSNDLAAWIEVKYELKNHEKLNGRTYDRTRLDVEVAYTALSDASIPVRDAARFGPRILESKLKELDGYLTETAPGTPYREAIIAAKRTLDAASRGVVAPPPPPPSSSPLAVTRAQWPEPGQLAPNLRSGNIQLSDHRGKPAVLVFFKPGSETTDLSLAIADALEKRYGAGVMVIPLAVFGDVEAGIKDRNRLKLTVPVYDGTAAVAIYGVETVPRFAVIDPDGKVKWTFTGVGSETGFLVREQVDRLARPTIPNVPHGITPSPGSTTSPTVPRP